MTRKKQGFVLAAIAAMALATGAPAATSAETIKTKVKISKLTASGASGTVSSKESKCEKGRKVTLLYAGEYGVVRIGKAKTNSSGAWKIKDKIKDRGIFFARAAEKGSCAEGESKDQRLR